VYVRLYFIFNFYFFVSKTILKKKSTDDELTDFVEAGFEKIEFVVMYILFLILFFSYKNP